jgi:predicted Rossmann-fold nucleotide-binding protein
LFSTAHTVRESNQKPIVILNTDGFYDKMLEFFDVIIEQKFANKNAHNLYYVAKTPKEAVEYLKTYKPQDFAVKKEDIYSR